MKGYYTSDITEDWHILYYCWANQLRYVFEMDTNCMKINKLISISMCFCVSLSTTSFRGSEDGRIVVWWFPPTCITLIIKLFIYKQKYYIINSITTPQGVHKGVQYSNIPQRIELRGKVYWVQTTFYELTCTIQIIHSKYLRQKP